MRVLNGIQFVTSVAYMCVGCATGAEAPSSDRLSGDDTTSASWEGQFGTGGTETGSSPEQTGGAVATGGTGGLTSATGGVTGSTGGAVNSAGGSGPSTGGGMSGGDDVLQILPMGDSITLGVNGGYRNQLYRSLVADGHTIDFVGSEYDEFTEVNDREHDGHPGITTVSILDNFEDWLSRSTPPDVVLFMAGTNDLAWFYNGPMEDIVGGVRDIAFALLERLPEATVVVASIPPMSSSMVAPQDLDRSDLVVQFNTLLRASIDAARAEGHRVAFADVNAVLTTADLYDGIHPTREAHDKIAAVWYDVLSGLL